jgi:hypothetical protein
MRTLAPDDDRAAALAGAIRAGDRARLRGLLDRDRSLAAAWIRERRGDTDLDVAAGPTTRRDAK